MPKPRFAAPTTTATSTVSTNNVVGKNLWWMMKNIAPVPEEWATTIDEADTSDELQPLPCSSYEDVVDAFREAVLWTKGMDKGLAVVLACTVSTVMTGEQLWAKLTGPASCGKTTLVEAVAVARKYVFSTSIFRGFYSGFGSDDNSLIDKVRGKTLIVKDGDTLLQAPNLHQILAEARDIYDTAGRAHYRTGKSMEYSNIRITFILCGTSSLKSIDSSEAGERFLDCEIMGKIDDELEDEILLRVAESADRSLNYEATGDSSSHASPEMTRAKQLTGGYVEYLRENAQTLFQGITFSPEARRKCTRYGKLVAHLRARPSKKQDEHHEREFAPRLVSQLVRLAKCLAVVLGKSSVDAEVLERVRAVALDTAKGRGIDIVNAIRHSRNPAKGLDYVSIALLTGINQGRCLSLVKFFREIGVLETYRPKESTKIHWRLQSRFEAICVEVFDDTATKT